MYYLPYRRDDFASSEVVYWGRWIHNEGDPEDPWQQWAYDLVGARPRSDGVWVETKPGSKSSKLKNDDFVIYGKPVYAVSDGVVINAWRNAPDNPHPFEPHPDEKRIFGAGNFIRVREDDGDLVGYAHARPGTIPKNLCPHNGTYLDPETWEADSAIPVAKQVRVKAGDFLFRTGNSGRSSHPHLHFDRTDADKYTSLKMRFRHGHSIALQSGKMKTTSWKSFAGKPIPPGPVIIRPPVKVPAAGISRGATWGNSYWVSNSLGAFRARAQSLFDDRRQRLTWVSTFVEDGKRRFAGIARSATWANAFWVSGSRAAFEAKAQKLYDDEAKRLIHVHTYVENGTRYWMGIARSGNWASSFWISDSYASFVAKAQDLFDNRERRLTFVQTYREGGKRHWIGIGQGGTWANTFWVSKGYSAFKTKAQKLFDERGRRLVHVHTYVDAGVRYWAGISRSGTWSSTLWMSGDIGQFDRTAQDLFEEKGQRLMVVEFLNA